jgi:hypothetical protein
MPMSKEEKEDKVFKKPEIEINLLRDGWEIWVGNKYYHYKSSNANNDKGVYALQVLFADLGFEVDLKETY